MRLRNTAGGMCASARGRRWSRRVVATGCLKKKQPSRLVLCTRQVVRCDLLLGCDANNLFIKVRIPAAITTARVGLSGSDEQEIQGWREVRYLPSSCSSSSRMVEGADRWSSVPLWSDLT
jgi:hypothetical protein